MRENSLRQNLKVNFKIFVCKFNMLRIITVHAHSPHKKINDAKLLSKMFWKIRCRPKTYQVFIFNISEVKSSFAIISTRYILDLLILLQVSSFIFNF